MGLDMYLEKSIYVGANWGGVDATVRILNSKGVELPINVEKISTIVESFGYWRKANAIHQWFVENVQDDVDNCGRYYVGMDNIKELLSLVNEVLLSPDRAPDLLPTTSGFFFGGTEYDDWYFDNLKTTKEILERAIKEKEDDKTNSIEFYYTSSW